MTKAFPFFGNTKIRITSKFTILFIIVGIVPLAFSGIISYSVYQKDIKELTINSAVSNVEIIRDDLNYLFGGTERFLKIGETHWPMLFFETAEDKYNYAKEVLSIFDYYRKSYDFNHLVRNIYIIGLNGRCLSERRGIYYNHKSFISNSRYLSEILKNGDGITIIPEHKSNYDKIPSDEIVVSIGTVLYNTINFEPSGVVILDLDPAEIKKIYMDFKFIDVGRISLIYTGMNPDNLPEKVSTYWETLDTKEIFENKHLITPVKHEPYLFVNSSTNYIGLKVLGTVPVSDLLSGVYTVRNYTMVSLFVSIILIVLIYLIISNGLMRPLREIQISMNKAAAGDLDINIVSSRSNMISDLYDSFTKMLYDLKNYIIAIDEEHRKYINAELRVLQEQINPHFLYNTLDTILWSAVSQGNNEIVELVSEMSTFFRLSLNKGADYVTVEDEINCITSYLNIQQIRYRDILEFRISCEEDVLKCKVLKLVLQPLVENALYHGIKTKRGKGLITVTVMKRDKRLYFSVCDNGAGMSTERLKELQRYLKNPSKYMGVNGIGVGLLNVQTRIMLRYDLTTGMQVNSAENEGTEIYFSLPASEM